MLACWVDALTDAQMDERMEGCMPARLGDGAARQGPGQAGEGRGHTEICRHPHEGPGPWHLHRPPGWYDGYACYTRFQGGAVRRGQQQPSEYLGPDNGTGNGAGSQRASPTGGQPTQQMDTPTTTPNTGAFAPAKSTKAAVRPTTQTSTQAPTQASTRAALPPGREGEGKIGAGAGRQLQSSGAPELSGGCSQYRKRRYFVL